MSFNLEKMILAEAIKAGHIRLKDLTQGFTEVPRDEEEKLLNQMLLNGEFTVDSLQSRGLLAQATIDSLMGLICENESDIHNFGHYSNLEPAGNGAMAWVYKAYDSNLRRYVALKVLKLSDPNVIQRFIREARSQAQIEHPNICKIYEAGEFQGRSFIAMQYINGKTLKEISGELSSEVKINLMRQIAEAVQEAHRKNLIHRDLKPANLMVEEKDGALKPYVVDFGLVREAGSPGLTQTDILIGSPFYMSPEQASGKVHSLDRRTDIYTLGVTLYELFSGTLPHVADDNIQVLRKIVEEDPAPLRKVNRFIPRDLETIILKCLEKDPAKRYDAAKDLADDLQRYLNGETIQAKPSTFTYRLSKKIKKNKRTVAILGLALLLVSIFGWIGIQSRSTARKQIAVAQQFGEDINQVESMMRIARMRPLHDISAEQEKARRRIEQIDKQAKQLGSVAFAPGEYALGKGYFVLQDYAKAQQHLEKAWRNGYQKSNVASVLGQTLVALYQEKLREADKIRDKISREQQREIILKTYLDPAHQYLKISSGTESESRELIEALMAYVEQRFDVALKKADAAYSRNGGLYEAKKIEADIHLELARNSLDSGDFTKSTEEFLQAHKDYLEAITIGRSDSSLYEGISFSKVIMMNMEIFYRGGDPSQHFAEAVSFSNQALQIYPKDIRAREISAHANFLMGEYESRNGRDPTAYLDKSVETVQTALAIAPSAELYRIMAAAYWSLSDYQNYQGEDERSSLQKSIQASQKALEIDPRYGRSYSLMGLAYNGLALYEAAHGRDPHPNFQKAVNALDQAVAIQPHEKHLSNLAYIYFEKAAYEFGQDQDVRSSVQKSVDAYQKAININPKAAATWSNLGNIYMILGTYESAHGSDSRSSFAKAIEAHSKAQAITPNLHQPYNNMAASFTYLASYEISQGIDPNATLQKAIENCEKALRIRPNYAFAYINLGTSYRYLAENQKKNLMQNLTKSDQAYVKSLELSPNNAEAMNGRGNVALLEAEWLISQKKKPDAALLKTEKVLGEVIKTNPQDMDALIGLAELHRWRGEWMISTKQSSSAEVDAGFAIIKKILSVHPQMAKAYAVQGMLYLVKAKEIQDSNEKAKLLEQARHSIEKAITLNTNLRNQYAQYISSRQ